eukprot:GAHX01000980.1.p1 GENE.GAHX01000980.1~~GAHX01000980.1.p1  ORF type:complete len:100 (+),score=16.58 GAHX01000980.1:87-386(+)
MKLTKEQLELKQERIKHFINSLPKSESLTGIEDNRCTICDDLMGKENPGYILFCLHTFHKKCMFYWFLRKPRCPLCNENVILMEKRNKTVNDILSTKNK